MPTHTEDGLLGHQGETVTQRKHWLWQEGKTNLSHDGL